MRKPAFAFGLCAVLVAASGSVTSAGPINSVFNPGEYVPLGTLDLGSGDSVTIDTDARTISGAFSTTDGVHALSQGGGVEMAVFVFDSVHVAPGATVNVTGNRGLVLASQSNLTFDAILNMSGADASGSGGGAGGPGGEGGVPGTSFASNPPGASRGNGGNGGVQNAAQAGVGYGGGGIGLGSPNDQQGGGGGGYGGAGGAAAADGTGSAAGGPGGVVYGDLGGQLTELYGGSGGAGGRHVNDVNVTRGGGGGGGALELVAEDVLFLGGSLAARGGNGDGDLGPYTTGGGGGSGGGIIAAARQIHFGGTIDARGGAGGAVSQTDRAGGGGGGGRVAFYTDWRTGSSSPASDVLLGGGLGPDNAADGSPGTFFQGTFDLPRKRLLEADADSWVQVNAADENFNNRDYLQIKNGGSDFHRKSYIRFDLGSQSMLDPSVFLSDATLKLNFINGAGTENAGLNWEFELFGLNDGNPGETWVEGDGGTGDSPPGEIDWNNAPANDGSSGNGVTGDATSLGTFNLVGKGLGLFDFSSPELTSFLRDSTSDDLVTFILVRNSPEVSGQTYVHTIASRERGGGLGPQLSLTFQVPEPGSALLFGLGAFALLPLLRRRRTAAARAA